MNFIQTPYIVPRRHLRRPRLDPVDSARKASLPPLAAVRLHLQWAKQERGEEIPREQVVQSRGRRRRIF